MIPLALGTLLALVALGVVLFPLFANAGYATVRRTPASRAPAMATGDDPVDVLREIEFDRATGKLSDDDYDALKRQYTDLALAALRARDAAGAQAAFGVEDAAEAEIRRQRATLVDCAACGPRPESDARYCSDCGRFLAGRCAGCGAAAEEPSARFCVDCGHPLAA